MLCIEYYPEEVAGSLTFKASPGIGRLRRAQRRPGGVVPGRHVEVETSWKKEFWIKGRQIS